MGRLIYLSSTTRQFFDYGQPFGCMFNIVKRTARQFEALDAGCKWMLDNGAFSGKWTLDLWLKELSEHRFWRFTCLGAIVPDVVADWEATLYKFNKYWEFVYNWGYKVAYATQDGQPRMRVPWDRIDVLFIGGSDEHKRGPEAEHLALEAKRRGKWVHIGRVNSGSALVQYWPWADSCDGTTFSRHPTQQIESIQNGIKTVTTQTHQARRLL